MNKLLCILAILVSLCAPVLAQPQSEKGKRSDEIQLKMQRTMLLSQIMPIALTKEQINGILPKIEKMRAEQRKIMASEDDELAKIESKLDDAIKAATEKGTYPSMEVMNTIANIYKVLGIRRNAVLSEMTDELYTDLKASLNAGQMAVMVKTLDAKLLNPEKPDEVKDEQRAKAFIRAYLLDPLAYDLLVKLSAK